MNLSCHNARSKVSRSPAVTMQKGHDGVDLGDVFTKVAFSLYARHLPCYKDIRTMRLFPKWFRFNLNARRSAISIGLLLVIMLGCSSLDSTGSTPQTVSTPMQTAKPETSKITSQPQGPDVRPWENIDCSVTPIPDAPMGTAAVTGWIEMDYPPNVDARSGLNVGGHVLRGKGSALFALGPEGSLLRLGDGPAWTRLSTGTNANLNDMFIGSWTAYIVGTDGVILTYSLVNGAVGQFETPFDEWESPERPDLEAVWGDNSEDFYVLGDGAFYHYNDGVWEVLTPPTSGRSMPGPTIVDVYVPRISYGAGLSNQNLFVLLSDNTVSYWKDSEWENTKMPTNSLVRGIWGLASDDIFAVGVGGLVLHYDGIEWSPFNDIGLSRFNSYTDIWGTSHSNLYIVGDGLDITGPVLHFDGSTWTTMPMSSPGGIRSVWGSSGSTNDVYLSDRDGGIWRYVDPGPPISIDKRFPVEEKERGLFLMDVAVASDDYRYTLSKQSFQDELGGDYWWGMHVRVEELSFSYHLAGTHILPTQIAVDDRGDIYVAGQTSGPIGGQPHSGGDARYEPVGSAPVSFDAFVMKFSSPLGSTSTDLDLQWARIFGNPDHELPVANQSGEEVSGLSLNPDGGLLVSGQNAPVDRRRPENRNIFVNFAHEASQPFSVENLGLRGEIRENYFYLGLFNANGSFIKGQGWGTGGFDSLTHLVQTASGEIYLVGYSSYEDFIDDQRGSGMLVIKLDDQWNRIWTRFLQTRNYRSPSSVTLTGNDGIFLGHRNSLEKDLVTEIGPNGVIQGTSDLAMFKATREVGFPGVPFDKYAECRNWDIIQLPGPLP